MVVIRASLALAYFCVIVWGLSYEDLRSLRAQCDPHDSCTSNDTQVTNSFVGRNCECDPECHLYHDCCIDAPTWPEQRLHRRIPNLKCMSYGVELHGVYTIDRCSRIWRGPSELRRKCERSSDTRDPLMAAPATDPMDGITYKNRYCAECNNVDSSTLKSWGIGLRCDSFNMMNFTGAIPRNYPEEHLIFKTTYPYRNTWGVYYWNSTISRMDFHPCKLSFVLPEYLQNYVRFCRPDVVSTCSPEWRLHVLRQQCDAYMAVVYVDFVPYRNPHCVLCNNLDLRTRSCSAGVIPRRSPAMSFTLLLDVNTRDGNRVGRIEESSCPGGQKWDPFFRKCRTLVCALPGYRMVQGKCVK